MRNRLVVLLLVAALAAVPLMAGPFGWVVSAYDLAATSYTYCTSASSTSSPVCGSGAEAGWIYMPDSRPYVATVEWITKNATSLEYTIECRANIGTAGQALLTDGLSAVGTENLVVQSTAGAFDQCRIGLKLTTDTGENSVSAFFATRN